MWAISQVTFNQGTDCISNDFVILFSWMESFLWHKLNWKSKYNLSTIVPIFWRIQNRFLSWLSMEMMEFSVGRFQDLELTDHENALMVAVVTMYPGEAKHTGIGNWFGMTSESIFDVAFIYSGRSNRLMPMSQPTQRIVYFNLWCKMDDGKTKCFIIHNKLHKALRKLLMRRVEQQEFWTSSRKRVKEWTKYGALHVQLAWKPVFENFEEVIRPPKIVKEWFNVDH